MSRADEVILNRKLRRAADRIAELEAELSECQRANTEIVTHSLVERDKLKAEVAQYALMLDPDRNAPLLAERDRLREALKPLADLADDIDFLGLNYDFKIGVNMLLLRAARAALSPTPSGGK